MVSTDRLLSRGGRAIGRHGGVVLVAAGLLMAGCTATPPDALSVISKSSLRHLPRECVGLAVVEVKSLKDREAVGRWLDDFAGTLGSAPEWGRVRAAIGPKGIDKLDRIALALLPGSGGPGTADYAILAEGDFDEQVIKDLKAGPQVMTLLQAAGQRDISVTVLPDGDLALGTRAVLDGILASLTKPEAGLAQGSLIRVLKKARPSAQIWGGIDYAPVAALTREALRSRGKNAPIPDGRGPGSLQAIAFESRIDKKVDFDLIGIAETETAARQLTEAARGLVALARMGASQNRQSQWLSLLDGLSIDQAGSDVKVHGAIDGEFLKTLAAGFGSKAAGDAAGGTPAR